MKVLIVGGGGREHAFAWKCAQSERVHSVIVAPGNAGTAREGGKVCNINIAAQDIAGLVDYAQNHSIDLTIVGPEVPLANGIVDQFQKRQLAIFGPSRKAAQLESSKSFCKDFMTRHNIPTADYQTFTDDDAALDHLKQSTFPIVIKADGLAAGKGVIIAQNYDQAAQAVHAVLTQKRFGDAGQHIVIESFLHGEEASFICLCDGKNLLPLASSQDHKARDDGDLGPNTGGMGAYSPAAVVSAAIERKIIEQVMQPALDGMAQEGAPFVGFLYAGLMIDEQGELAVLEFNCRMGDPEAQPLLMRMQSDLVTLCEQCLAGTIATADIHWDSRVALAVVLASRNYPESYSKGQIISGLDQGGHEDTKVFHAGTQIDDGQVVTAGGRVLSVVALGQDIAQAQQYAYQACAKIQWDDMFYRKDIGWRALPRA